MSANLLLGCIGSGCNKPEGDPNDIYEGAVCSAQTKCPSGYKCDYGASGPNSPQSAGQCRYQECGLTDLCKKPQEDCGLPQETALCDKKNNDKYCDCQRPNSQELPSTPTTDGTPTTGSPPTTGDKP